MLRRWFEPAPTLKRLLRPAQTWLPTLSIKLEVAFESLLKLEPFRLNSGFSLAITKSGSTPRLKGKGVTQANVRNEATAIFLRIEKSPSGIYETITHKRKRAALKRHPFIKTIRNWIMRCGAWPQNQPQPGQPTAWRRCRVRARPSR